MPNQIIVVAPKSGKILIRPKGKTKFEPLDVTKGIPVGSEVDATHGHVLLTSIPKAGKPPETGEFWDGFFIVTQKNGITDLALSQKLTGCPATGKKASIALAAKKPKTRRLWGSGKGNFQTTGKYSSATIRGTNWLVADACTSTTTTVKQGVVSVKDLVLRKTVLVKAKHKYVAKKAHKVEDRGGRGCSP